MEIWAPKENADQEWLVNMLYLAKNYDMTK
jgi:hypothetical protein